MLELNDTHGGAKKKSYKELLTIAATHLEQRRVNKLREDAMSAINQNGPLSAAAVTGSGKGSRRKVTAISGCVLVIASAEAGAILNMTNRRKELARDDRTPLKVEEKMVMPTD